MLELDDAGEESSVESSKQERSMFILKIGKSGEDCSSPGQSECRQEPCNSEKTVKSFTTGKSLETTFSLDTELLNLTLCAVILGLAPYFTRESSESEDCSSETSLSACLTQKVSFIKKVNVLRG